MYLKILISDFKKNPGSSLAMLFFMILSAGVTAAVFLMLAQLFTSISGMYETAKPPHFLQMHKGELDQERIDKFQQEYPGIVHGQTVTMVDIYGENLIVEGEKNFSLSDCQLDIGLVRQNETYDLLLDDSRNKVVLNEGEIGIPVILLEQYPIELGDKIELKMGNQRKVFTAAAFIHDAQMNSTLCSSTRFLISDTDFNELTEKTGEKEYIIETWFEDSSMAADYQSAYEQSGLPQNGQAVTYSVMFLLSAVTDIMTGMVFLLVGILLIFISLLCMKYTVMAGMEEDLTEIGTMKALGVPYASIRDLYLGKMRILMLLGTILGYAAAVTAAGFFTARMSRTFGEQPISGTVLLISAAAGTAVYLIFMQYCRNILKKLKKVTVLDALVTEKGFRKDRKARDELQRFGKIPVNLLMGLHILRQNLSEYSVVFLIMLITAFLVLVPQNLVSTLKSEEFITYMGSGMHDVMVEVEQGTDVDQRWKRIMHMLGQEEDVELQSMRRVKIAAEDGEGGFINLHIDTGSESGKGLKYLDGKAPVMKNEIALSVLLAEQMDRMEGDSLELMRNGERETFYVCGIYQDVTSGGMTAKTVCEFPETASEQYTIYADLGENTDKKSMVSRWQEQAGGGYAIAFMEEFVSQTLGGVAYQVRTASFAAFGIGIILILLIIGLFMKLRIAGELPQIAYKRAMGIAVKDVRLQEFYPVFFIACAGVIGGMVLANQFGDSLAGLLLSALGLGIKSIRFAVKPWISWLFIPLLLMMAAAAAGRLASLQIGKHPIDIERL